MRRVAGQQVFFTWDPGHSPELWLLTDYLPEIRELENARFTPLVEVVDALDAHTVRPFPIPHDLTAGFQTTFWHLPERSSTRWCASPARPPPTCPPRWWGCGRTARLVRNTVASRCCPGGGTGR